jgi:hypothetical protein
MSPAWSRGCHATLAEGLFAIILDFFDEMYIINAKWVSHEWI